MYRSINILCYLINVAKHIQIYLFTQLETIESITNYMRIKKIIIRKLINLLYNLDFIVFL